MSFSPDLAAIRFGYGLSPSAPPPTDRAALLDQLNAPDIARMRFPVPDTTAAVALGRALSDARKMEKKMGESTRGDAVRHARRALREAEAAAFVNQLQRAVQSPEGFRERLQFFWADHFTVTAKSNVAALLPSAFADEAIRPHLNGRFPEMLRAAVTHPAMLLYLDQFRSIGPDSRFAKRADAKAKRNFGLNENLARELMELHTLGVGAPYTQTDVRQMAKLLTGLGFNAEGGFVFHPNWAEPGAETVLGRRYGGEEPARLSDIFAALDDIALNPATARHVATKLAVHFVSDSPDPGLVDAMTAAYSASGGDLPKVYAAMLDHPAAWAPIGPLSKARQPWDFVAAGLRVLGTPPETLAALKPAEVRRDLYAPLSRMGQRWQRASGPNGWHEDAGAWITPQGLAARIDWAMGAARRMGAGAPDPRAFVGTALGTTASATLTRAAARAESRTEGVGLILASADFNRR